ncbi:MAG: flagellar hook-associated protein FlgK [Candidatus Sedimenticola sp. 6PFRAG7]
MATIFGIGTSALLSYQRVLSTVGHNVANANTEGYSRQRVNLSTRTADRTPAGWIGNGVDAVSVQRFYDDFIATQMRGAQTATTEMQTLLQHASRLDNLLADPAVGLDPAIQDFFNALQDVSDNPASASSRQVLLAEGESLASRFVYIDRQYDQLRQDIYQEITNSVTQINTLAANIADVNRAIVKARSEINHSEPNDLLDQREMLLNDLSKYVNVQNFLQDDGAMNVIIGTGQPLVVGWENAVLSVSPNAANPTSPDIRLSVDGGASSIIVTDQVSSGELGGLLRFREEYLDEGQSQLGKLAVGLVESINAQHVQGIDLLGQMGGNFYQPITVSGAPNLSNTGSGAVSVSFSAADMANLTSSDYQLVYNGGTSYTLTRLSDGTTTAINSAAIPVVDGFQMAITAGAAIGDSFLLRPTRDAAGEVSLLVSDVNRIAAAGALRGGEVTDASGNPLNTGDASISAISTSSATGLGSTTTMTLTYSNSVGPLNAPGFTITSTPALATNYIYYNPATESAGKSFPDGTVPGQFDPIGGASFHIKGTPAVGDAFLAEFNSGGTADNSNALALAGLQNDLLMNGGTATFQNVYSQLVSDVGAKTHQAEISFRAQEGLLSSHAQRLAEISGVNLDEEAADLARFQQAYQASAQVIQVANSLFESLLNAVGR